MPGTLSATNQSDSIISFDPNVPSDIKGNPLEWNGNNAHIDGLLFETGQHCVRHNIFIPLIENHAVLLSNGKTAVDSLAAVPFIRGTVADPHDFADPCPPTAQRIVRINAERAASAPPTPPLVPLAAAPRDLSSDIIIL